MDEPQDIGDRSEKVANDTYIEVQQCDLDFEAELREAYRLNGPVVSLIAEFREASANAAIAKARGETPNTEAEIADLRRAALGDIGGGEATASPAPAPSADQPSR